MKESDLVKSCLEYLTLKRIFHHRNNTGAFSTSTGGFYRFGAVGSSDIISVVDGRYIAIECKVKKNPQSPAQKQFQQELEQAGGKYLLVYSLDELINKLKELI